MWTDLGRKMGRKWLTTRTAVLRWIENSAEEDTFARAIERRTLVWQTAGRRQKEGEVPEPTGRPAPAPV